MYTKNEFGNLTDLLGSDHEFPVVMEYDEISKGHEYHMMQFLLMDKDRKESLATSCPISMQMFFSYFRDWADNAVIDEDQIYADRHIGLALYCFLELFDAVYGKKTYSSDAQRILKVSDYLIIVDHRETHKPDPVLLYAKESRYHRPYIYIFDEPVVCPQLKSKMRLLAKHTALMGNCVWVLYCPHVSCRTLDWENRFVYTTRRHVILPNESLPIGVWSRQTGKMFDPSGNWRKEFLKATDPCYFTEDIIRPKATLPKAIRMIENQKAK